MAIASLLSGSFRLPFRIALLALVSTSCWAAQPVPSETVSGTVVNQMAVAFAGNQTVQQVQLSGSAVWTSGSLQDSGSVTLTASSNGLSVMQLSLSSTGQQSEAQTGTGLNTTCGWSGADGVSHSIDQIACERQTLWFLPAFSLQPTLLPGALDVADLGIETVGTGTTLYRHLQSQLSLSDQPAALPPGLVQATQTDIGLDSTTLLPAVLAYTVHPDNCTQVPIAIEIHYSNYQIVNGVQIPFQIEKYVNGSLLLQISLNSAVIN